MNRIRRIIITSTRRRTRRLYMTLLSAHCPVCSCEVDTLARPQAAEVLEIDGSALDDLITDGRLHTVETVNGNLRVCKNSLFSPLR